MGGRSRFSWPPAWGKCGGARNKRSRMGREPRRQPERHTCCALAAALPLQCWQMIIGGTALDRTTLVPVCCSPRGLFCGRERTSSARARRLVRGHAGRVPRRMPHPRQRPRATTISQHVRLGCQTWLPGAGQRAALYTPSPLPFLRVVALHVLSPAGVGDAHGERAAALIPWFHRTHTFVPGNYYL